MLSVGIKWRAERGYNVGDVEEENIEAVVFQELDTLIGIVRHVGQ